MVAASTRTSTDTVRLPPTGVTTCSCSVRSSLACADSAMSPISSRKIVPLSGVLEAVPCRFRLSAPVNAPFSWPNSSLSISSEGIAAQFTATNGASLRGERACSCRAISSLPVPFSPVISTVAWVGATRSMAVLTCWIASLPPRISNSLAS